MKTFMAPSARAIAIRAGLLVIATIVMANPASALVPQAGNPLQHQFKQDSSSSKSPFGAAARCDVPRSSARAVAPRAGRSCAAARLYVPDMPAAGCGGLARLDTLAQRRRDRRRGGYRRCDRRDRRGMGGSPPAPGMCWYYTDPSQTQGFWDYCQ